jgi:hypothetical protein
MGKQVRQPGENVREFILRNLDAHPNDIVAVTAAKFGCTRQAVHKHLTRLVEQGSLAKTGTRQTPAYKAAQLDAASWSYSLETPLAESDVWERDLFPLMQALPKNVLGIWEYAFTEMVNNAIDHSGGKTLAIRLERTATKTTIEVRDDGIGIFRKIQGELDLVDERQAIFELSKGKLTTDPANHTGQGIFFSSRMMDEFTILSGGLMFDHERGQDHDLLIERVQPKSGTIVAMVLNNHTSRSTKKVFDEYSSKDEEYTFNKTVVPMTLAKFGPSELVSRSQAKRLLARVDLFEVVIFDFKGVETIGQAFADEIFRVFARSHPRIQMPVIHATKQVKDMIARARSEFAGMVASAPKVTAPKNPS